MTVNRNNRILNIADILFKITDNIEIFRRNRIAHRIGDIDCCCSSFDHRLDHFCQKWKLCPNSILSREFNIRGVTGCKGNSCDSGIQNFLLTHFQLVLHMDITGCNKGMNSSALSGIFQSIPGTVNIQFTRTG